MYSVLGLALMLGTQGQLPDDLDLFRTDPKANILFLLDSSGSMSSSYGTIPTGCTWFASTYNSGNTSLSKNQMMKASLVGCTASDDGILDRWSSRLNIAVWHFGGSVAQLAAFGANLSALETAVRSTPATGGTPMTTGLRSAGNYFRTAFNDTTHPSCRKDYIVIMSDGEPNGGAATFNYNCVAPLETLSVSADQPWFGSRYLYRDNTTIVTPRDSLCTTTGVQPIRTFSVGFEALDTFDETTLVNIASYGDGTYHHATSITELTQGFEGILSNIVARGRVDYSAPATQTTGLFADNYVYSAYFKPIVGPWLGTVKKFCIEPRRLTNGRYDTTQRNCLYSSTDGRNLIVNTAPQDLFTFVTSPNADAGGTGEAMFTVLGAGPNRTPVAPYWGRRNILTWRDNTGYVAVNPTNLSRADTWTNGCEHYRLINFLHGYSFDADCNNGNPVQVRTWPMGAPIHSSPLLLKYGRCHNTSDVPVTGMCYLVQAMNDGMIHFFDAANGRETSALVPADFWKMSRVAKHRMDRIDEQPTTDFVQRYYVDGGVRLLHDDRDGDTVIDAGENARLIFGLGRGGSAYYQIAVDQLPGGVLTTARNPIYPLAATRNTAYDELRETWHPPYIGRMSISGTKYAIAAFGSGHVASLDNPSATMGTQPPGLQPAIDVVSTTRNVLCTGTGGFALYNGYLSTGTNLCSVAWKPGCLGTRTSQCYDTGYWATSPASTLPLNLQWGPLKYKSGTERAAAYRIQFSHFDLGPNDVLRIKDGHDLPVREYTGTSLDVGAWTDWIYDPDNLGFYIEFETDGIDTQDRGWEINNIQYVAITDESVVTTVAAHNPTLYILDALKWNGSTPQAFTRPPQTGAVLMRIAKQCLNSDTGTCIDQTRFPVLASLVCPISSEVTAYTEGDIVRALYFTTECGEIWKLWTDNGGTNWSVRRLLSLNTPGRTGLSKNFRKLFTRLDIVPSTCPGRRVVGLYFGTGNAQRPQATDELTDTLLNDGRDVIGTIWDDGSIDNLTITNLSDLSSATPGSTNAQSLWTSGKRGWYLRLNANERMLRDPLVFEGVAYYKTRQPATGTSECVAGTGTDRVYAVDNCTAAPVGDSNGSGGVTVADRERWTGTTDVGSELFLFTPRNGPPIVAVGDGQATGNARLNPSRTRAIARMYMWRDKAREE